MMDLVRITLIGLRRKGMRSVLIGAGIAIGVASVVLIGSIGSIGRDLVGTELSGMGMNSVAISPAVSGQLPLGDAEVAIIRDDPQVAAAAPVMVKMSTARMRGLVANTAIWGIDDSAGELVSMELQFGRELTQQDMQSGAAVCVVDRRVALAFYKRENIVGKTITLAFDDQMATFQIVGVVSTGGNLMQNMLGEYLPGFVYVPYTSMSSITGNKNFNQVMVKLQESAQAEDAAQALASTLSRRVGSESAYQAENLAQQKENLDRLLQVITIVLSVIAAISLLVSGLGIMTVMLVSVGERTREIGIKKAIGAGKAKILFEFLVEAFTLSAAGSLLGCLGGMALVALGCLCFGIGIRYDWTMILTAVVFSMGMGGVFGAYPAAQAANMRPVDALRYE